MFNWIFDRGTPVCFIKTNKKVCSFKGEAPIQWIFLFYESSFLVLNVKCSAFDMCHYMVECSLVFWAHFLVLPTSYKGSIRATEGNDEELHVQKISCQLGISHWSSFLDCYCCDLTRECLLSRFRLWRFLYNILIVNQ